MKKQKMQLLLLLAALVLLGGGYLGLKRYNSVQEEKEAEPEGEALVSLKEDEIIRFSYEYNDVEYSYEKDGDTWYYTPDKSLNLTQYRLNTIVSKLAGLRAQETITDVKDMSQYGLDKPSRTFSFDTEAESYVFYVGDYNSVTDTYYMCKPSGDTVYTVETTSITVLNLDVADIVEEEETAEETAQETAEETQEEE